MQDKEDARLRFSLERLRFSLPFRYSSRFCLIALFFPMLLGGILLVSYASQGHLSREGYETPVGEERTVILADGSSVHLRADTHITANSSSGLTELKLLRGRILIDVADKSHRVFRVDVPNARISDIGTQFEVATNGIESTVAVLEGAVEIARHKPFSELFAAVSMPVKQGEEARILSDGQFLLVPPTSFTGAIEPQALRRFPGTTLAEAAEDFDRNNTALRFVVEGDARRIRINGTFNLNRPESFARYLEQQGAIEVHTQGKIVKVRERAR